MGKHVRLLHPQLGVPRQGRQECGHICIHGASAIHNQLQRL